MSELPPGDDNPFGAMFPGGLPGGQMPDMAAMLRQVADMLSWKGGPVNWDMARQGAVAAASVDDQVPPAGAQDLVVDALRLADLWLDAATAMPSGVRSVAAWSRVGWVESTWDQWIELVDPVAAPVVAALGDALASQMPPEMAQIAGPMVGMLGQVGGVMMGTQLGQALGAMSADVLSATDTGLPMGGTGVAALLPANVTAFGTGLGIPAEEVRIFVALREAAHHRLFHHAPWLTATLLEAVADCSRGMTIDTAALQAAAEGIDPSNPEALGELLSGGLVTPEPTAEQRRAMDRLETLLALVDGWVEHVVDHAAAGHLPAAGALRETIRRRRATGGPAEATFATLVGLELRPRRAREAATLWEAVAAARGPEGRDSLWDHPDLLPTTDDLSDPEGFAAGRPELTVDDITGGAPGGSDEDSGGEAGPSLG
jgi:putative hydrolase